MSEAAFSIDACLQARVEQAGGQILYWNGHRVMGVLAMSRAIGDHGLRPYVISDPEVRRDGKDRRVQCGGQRDDIVFEDEEAVHIFISSPLWTYSLLITYTHVHIYSLGHISYPCI